MSYKESFDPEMLHTEVTAVKLLEDYIYAGVGSKLCVYHRLSIDVCIKRIKVFNRQKIYGILPSKCGEKMLIYGGEQYTVLSIDQCEGNEGRNYTKMFEAVCDDRLVSAAWLDHDVLAFLTAHNSLQKWRLSTQQMLEGHLNKGEGDVSLSSCLILPLDDSLLVLAGTAECEVFVYTVDGEPLHKLKGHKDAILSIACHAQKPLIVSTSSDKSVRLWAPNCPVEHATNIINYWRNVNLECKHVLHGHNCRVMRSLITENNIISVGEDSAMCHWNFEGKLYEKTVAHQNGGILCLDANDTRAVTGGADGAVIDHALVTGDDRIETETIHFDMGKIKNIKFTSKQNLLLLTETDVVLYDVPNKKYTTYKLDHKTDYKMIDLSDYRVKIAIADMGGKLDIFIETGKQNFILKRIMDTKLNIGRILSMHWTDNYLVFCSSSGVINILFNKRNNMEVHSSHILPPSKKRWLTAAAKYCHNQLFVCGDASGNVYMYTKGTENPIKSFSKLNGDRGPTVIYITSREVVTAWKNGTIKFFATNYNGTEMEYTHQKNLEFNEKFLDPYKEIGCGVRKGKFAVFNLIQESKLIELPCHGRKWDAVKYWEHIEAIGFVYLKNNNIVKVTVHGAKLYYVNAINGSHIKEVNCLKVCHSKHHNITFYVSGSDDNTLRISDRCNVIEFRGRVLLKHIDAVIAFSTFDLGVEDFLLVSAGGKGHICIRRIDFNKYIDFAAVTVRDVVDYVIGGTDPEMKVTDVDVIREHSDNFLVFAGCSDATIRIFNFQYKFQPMEPGKWLVNCGNGEFTFFKEIKCDTMGSLKIICIRVSERDILVTGTTTGEILFWDIRDLKSDVFEPLLKLNVHRSALNSITHIPVTNEKFLIATAGDDNAIHLKLLEIGDQNNLVSLKVVQEWSSSQHHSSRITGLCFKDKYMVSACVDQRVNLFEWRLSDEGIVCDLLSGHWTDVASVRGLDLMESSSDSIIYVCVFGKGIEVIGIPIKPLKSSLKTDS